MATEGKITRTQKRKEKRRLQKLNLFTDQKGKCFWCGFDMLPFPGGWPKFKKYPRNMATIDHVFSRLHEKRQDRPNGEKRIVVACYGCNQKRCNQELQSTPIEELHRRSKRSGLVDTPQSQPVHSNETDND